MDVAAILAIAILPFLAFAIFQWVRDDDGDKREKKGRDERMGMGKNWDFTIEYAIIFYLFQNLLFC